MEHQLEAMALLTEISLPHGYRVREIEGRLYLFDPQGIPLDGPKDPTLLEAYAWRHAWRRIERELDQELANLRSGVLPLNRLHRVRQYLRMLDAVAQAPPEVERRPTSRRVVAWGAFAASAAAIAAVLLMTPLRTGQIVEKTPPRLPPSLTSVRTRATQPARALPAPTVSPGERSREATRAVPTGPRPATLARYAVSFGEYFNRTTADTVMHFIRSKGYIVYVAGFGDQFRVVTRPYHTRAQAERMANALKEIGLPAQLTSTRAISSDLRPAGSIARWSVILSL